MPTSMIVSSRTLHTARIYLGVQHELQCVCHGVAYKHMCNITFWLAIDGATHFIRTQSCPDILLVFRWSDNRIKVISTSRGKMWALRAIWTISYFQYVKLKSKYTKKIGKNCRHDDENKSTQLFWVYSVFYLTTWNLKCPIFRLCYW